MKKQYDFKDGRRGAILRAPSGKTRITIRIDDEVLQWFRDQVDMAGGGSYQTRINDALRRFAESADQNLEGTLRRVLREELLRSGPAEGPLNSPMKLPGAVGIRSLPAR